MVAAGDGWERARHSEESGRRRPGALGVRLGSSLISGACAVGFALWVRNQRLPHLPADVGGDLAVLLGVMAYSVATIGLCERWSFLLRREASSLSHFVGYRPALLGQLGNMFLPARVGDALRVGLVSTMNEEVSTVTAVGTVIAERALDIGCQTALLVVVIAGLFGPSIGVLGRGPSIVVGVAALASVTWVAGTAGSLVSSRAAIVSKLPKFLVAFLRPLVNLRRGSRTPVLLSAMMWASEVVGWWAASRAVGLNLNPLQAAYVFAVASLAFIAPVGFGAIGTLDAAIVFSIKTAGASTAPVLSFVLLLRVFFVLPSLMAVIGIAVVGKLSRRKTRAGGLWKVPGAADGHR
jgi:uncharacterized protein (TIRG00374 family)